MTMTTESGSPEFRHADRRACSRIRWRECDSPAVLADELATEVAADLARAVAARGTAAVVLPGGRTPRMLYRALTRAAVPWEAVTVIPSDERWVPSDDPRSNLGAIATAFAGTAAAKAHLISLYDPAASAPEDAFATIRKRLSTCPRPHDWVILGMGTDGHIASLFPGIVPAVAADDLVAAPPAPRPAGMTEARISLGLQSLCAARRIGLLITGHRKRRVLEGALAETTDSLLPVRLLAEAVDRLTVFWAPETADRLEGDRS